MMRLKTIVSLATHRLRNMSVTDRFISIGQPINAASAADSSQFKHTIAAGGVKGNDQLILRMMKTAASNIMVYPARSVSISGVLHCDRADRLPSVLKMLDEQKILSMPVCTKHNNMFTGFIEIQDIVTYIARHFANHKLTTFEDFQRLWDSIDGFNSTTVDQILEQHNPKVAPVHAVPQQYSLFHAFEILARTGYHRLCVANAEGQIVTIISQSMMIDYAKSNLGTLDNSIRHRKIGDLVGLHAGEPIVVKQTDRMLRAFQLMTLHNVSGVGVVDEMGKLVDVVSARDLRGSPLNAVSFWGLYSTVAQFKDSIRCNYPQTMKFLLTVKSSDTMEWAIEEMATHKVQRLFLVDDQGKPIKCIAQTDVLRNLLELPGVEA